jgi:hypothetical protein
MVERVCIGDDIVITDGEYKGVFSITCPQNGFILYHRGEEIFVGIESEIDLLSAIEQLKIDHDPRLTHHCTMITH